MKKLYYLAILALIIFEILNVYFIMPFPGSQRINSIGAAYFLYSWRWFFRVVLGLLVLVGGARAIRASKWHLAALVPLIIVAYLFNFSFAADKMFLQPKTLALKNQASNSVALERLIIGVANNGEAKAYPIQFVAYHHQIQDTIGGKAIIVTYCTVCRTGRVFEPLVDGKKETFRLVGMDRFNAMLEDAATGSWWRQANGEAIAGKRKGQILPEIDSTQTTLRQWLDLYPNSLIMQPDAEFAGKYADYEKYEDGAGGELTGTNFDSWQEKSWVVGITLGSSAKAYDWNRLQKERVINDEINGVPVVIALASDDKSFFAFERPSKDVAISLDNDTLASGESLYNLMGVAKNAGEPNLKKINASQEFWHSWRTFHPHTEKY